MADSHALQNLAGRGARARRPAAAGRRLRAHGVEPRAGNLHAARPAQLAPARGRDQASPPAVRSSTSRASSSATTSSTPSASARRSIASSWPSSARTTSRRSPSCALAARLDEPATKSASPASRQSSTSTGRPSTRSSTGRWSRRSARAPASSSARCCRGARRCSPSPREIEDLNNANHAIQRAEVTRRQEAFRTRAAPAHLGQPLPRSRRRAHGGHPAARARAALGERARRGRTGRAPDAPALAPARGHPGRGTQEPVARAPRPRRADADRAAHGARPHRPPALGRGHARGWRRRPSAASSWTTWSAPSAISRSASGPSMLDDFGLQPALEWHVRDFGRRFGVPVELTVDGDFDLLPEQHRTCVYRSVQEALTNCVRHARASHIAVSVSRQADCLAVLDHRRRRRLQPRAAGRRARSARHRGARPRSERCPVDQERRRRRARR